VPLDKASMKKNTVKKSGKGRLKAGKVENRFPPGWNEKKVQKLIAHYDSMTDDELVAEIESGLPAPGQTLISVPTELVPEVVKLINRHQRTAR
jgi:hypothetical protein